MTQTASSAGLRPPSSDTQPECPLDAEAIRPRDALSPCQRALIGAAVISGIVNLLYLTGSFFMLEVYDRVLPSRSVPTLVSLATIAMVLFAFQGALDFLRGRMFVRLGTYFDARMAPAVFRAGVDLALSRRRADPSQPSRDLDLLRQFIGGGGPVAFLDLPWIPIYVLICYLFHPLIGLVAVAGSFVLFAITLITERKTKDATFAATDHGQRRLQAGEAAIRNAEAVRAMGMADHLGRRWQDANSDYQAANGRISDVVLGFGAASKIFRMALQSFVLALGAWLVIQGEATGGIMIAASILVARALAPVEMVIGQWKGFVAARHAWDRLDAVLAETAKADGMILPAPSHAVTLTNVTLVPPNGQVPNVHDVSFQLRAGDALAVVGSSASGKSSLARALVGVWQPVRGRVRLDGASLEQWPPQRLGRHVGYMPQGVELFAGTVAENIARFEPGFDPRAVIAAAEAAGIHELILSLPGGYDMQIGNGGSALSAGQRQRVALARALYADPFLVVLDEPNSNLDSDGDDALTRAILSVRERGGVVVVVAHRASAVAGCNLMMMMAGGRCQMIGEKDEVLATLTRPEPALRRVG